MSIDPAQPIPIYFQLKTLLLEEILGGRYGLNDRLPTEHELCERYGISRTPVTRALSELAEEGVILRHRRRGSFVNPHWLSRRPDQPEVRVVVPAEGPWAGMIRDAAGAGNHVSIVKVPRESLHQMLTHAVAEGVAPDLAVIDSVWTPEFAAAGFLHALEDLDEDWIREEHEVDFLEPLADSNRYGGRTFGIPAFADVAGLWYRKRELEARGLEPPGTWAELRSVAREIADRKLPHPIVMPGGSKGGETTAYCLIAFLASNGARVLQPEGVSLSSRATAQALRFLRSLVEADVMSTDVVALDWNRPIRLLADGHAAISFGGTYEAQALGEALGVPHRELWQDFGFMEVPAGPHGGRASVTGAMIYTVFRQAAQPAMAMRLLERAVASDALARMATTTGRIPSRRSAVALVSEELPFVAQTAEILERAVPRPWMPSYPRVSAQLQAMLEAVLTGRLSPASAAQRAAEMIGAITGLAVLEGVGEPVPPRTPSSRVMTTQASSGLPGE
jgi:ABC-type glycerol-3-phosphate transport system substrate-binding protein/DNA-binding transcriptional regulator YhcF (GntR family)